MLFPSLNINAFLDGIVGSHIVLEALVGQMIDYQLLEPIYSCVELVLEHNTSRLIFVTNNIKIITFCASAIFSVAAEKHWEYAGNNQNFKCNHICIHSMNLHANFLFVCSAELSFDYVGSWGNPSNFNICFMFSSRIKSPLHWSYFSCKNVKYVIERWQKEVLLQVVMKKGKSPLGATYLHSSLKITSNLLAALEMLFYKELQLSNFAFKVSRKGFWNCKLQNVNINHFENTTHPHTRFIYLSIPLFTCIFFQNTQFSNYGL